MDYVLLEFETGLAYQESNMGMVTRYLSPTGEFLFDHAPEGLHGVVVDSNPPRLDWMV